MGLDITCQSDCDEKACQKRGEGEQQLHVDCLVVFNPENLFVFRGWCKDREGTWPVCKRKKSRKKSGKKSEGEKEGGRGRGEPSVKGLGYLCMFAIQEQTHCDQTGCFVAVNHHHLDSFSPSPPFVQLRIYFGSTDAGVTPSNCDYPYNHL